MIRLKVGAVQVMAISLRDIFLFPSIIVQYEVRIGQSAYYGPNGKGVRLQSGRPGFDPRFSRRGFSRSIHTSDITLNFLVAVMNTLDTKTHSSNETAEFSLSKMLILKAFVTANRG